MENNQYLRNLQIAKEFLKDRKETLQMWVEQRLDADKKFIGDTLEKRERELTKWIEETNVEVEMAENYIKNIEEFIQQDAYITEQERLAQDKAESLENNNEIYEY